MRDGPQPKLAAWGPHGRGKHERDIKLLSDLDEEELEIFRKLEEQVAQERHRGGLRTRFSILRTIASMKDGELIDLIALYEDGLKSGGGGGGSASGGPAQQVDSSQQVAADVTETSSAPSASLQPESSDAMVGLPEGPAEPEEDPPVSGAGNVRGGGGAVAPKWQDAGAVEESSADTPPGLGLGSPEMPAPVAPPQPAAIPDVVPEVPVDSTGTTGQDWGVGAWMPEESLPPPPAPPPPPGPEVPPPPPMAAPVTAPVASPSEEETKAWEPQPPADNLAAPPSPPPASDPPISMPPPINGDSREDEVHVASTPANEPPKSEREIPTSSSGLTSKLNTSLESWFRKRAFELRVGPTSLSAGSAEVLEVLMGLEDSQLAPPYTEVKMWLGFEEQEDMPESLAKLVTEFRAIRAKGVEDSSHLMPGDGRPVPSGKDFPPPPARRAPGGPNPKGPVAPPARAGGGKASAWR